MHTTSRLEMVDLDKETVSESENGSSPTLSLNTPSTPRQYNKWSPMEEGITLAWRDLNVYAHCKLNGKKSYKRIINGASGAVKTGSLVAVMGASGSGKSTLMSALAYRNPGATVVEGEVLVNGRPIGDYMRSLSGFMHQDEFFVGSLTVWEHLNIMARLKLDRRTSKSEMNLKIEELIRNLGLTKCKYTRIGVEHTEKVLSGGEKKRLAFATELLTDPQLLFCDEPTTGLDSYCAQKIVAMMNFMTSSGKTIVCTIHQPSSEVFAMFSQMILLADGRIAYMGSNSNALDFFQTLGYNCPNNYNPADFYIRTLAVTPGSEEASKQTIRYICDHFAVSEYIKEVEMVIQYEFHMGRSLQAQTFRTNFKEQLWFVKLFLLIYRGLLAYWRDTWLLAIRLVEKMAVALLIGLCYVGATTHDQKGIQAIQGAIFILICENTFIPMYSVMAVFPQDRPLFLREYRSGLYSVGMYYFAKIAAMVPGLMLETFIFSLIAYWLVGLRATSDSFWLTTFVILLTLNVSLACGIFFSNAFDSIPSAMSFLAPFDFLLMIVSGLFLKLSSLPNYISWTKYLSWIMYASESLAIVQWEGVHNITCETTNEDIPCLTEGSEVMERYSFSFDNFNRDLWNMFIIGLIFHVLAFLCLCRKTKRK
ncbi:hypothetical protein PPYR_04279 [Photinus pyralis]|uniref:ABC transporter domain-containing protein n=1 Tax=Photinus pyralis TaxID=7054 RepID=A0A5N4AXT2_PHOPY|nr:protein scarlet-like [Photinus pyralis]KAB0802093.1 hypothetical protein PPYR_04279 [Photinus pyralis]